MIIQTKQCDLPKCKKQVQNTDPVAFYNFGHLQDHIGRNWEICGDCIAEIIGEDVMPTEPAEKQPE